MTENNGSTADQAVKLHIEDQIELEAGELPNMRHLPMNETGRQDRLNMADYIGNIAANTRVHLLMEPAAATLYTASVSLCEDDNPLGHVLMLDSLIASPDAVQAMLRCLRAELVECDPSLALMGPSPVPPEFVTPRYHRLDGATFFIDRDANLTIDERNERRPSVQLTAQEAYGLLTFMRLPGVAPLIETADAADQDRTWHDFEADTAQEMTDEQAYDRVMANPGLRGRIEHAAIQTTLQVISERIKAVKDERE